MMKVKKREEEFDSRLREVEKRGVGSGKRGRPRKPDSEKGTRGFYVRLTDEIADLVERDADREYRSKTAQISYIVEHFYRGQGKA